MSEPKVLYWDIETAPWNASLWGKRWDPKVIEFLSYGYGLSVSWAWGDGEPEFAHKARGKGKDKSLVKKIISLQNEADVIIAHNGDKFDIREINARALYHGIAPPSPYISIDTIKVARTHFALPSYKLNDIADYYELGHKTVHTGYALWKRCMQGEAEAWEEMRGYNDQDVILLRDVYKLIRPWMNRPGKAGTKFNAQQWYGVYACPTCGSQNTRVRKEYQIRTKATVRHAVQCQDCKAWSAFKRVGDLDTGEYR